MVSASGTEARLITFFIPTTSRITAERRQSYPGLVLLAVDHDVRWWVSRTLHPTEASAMSLSQNAAAWLGAAIRAGSSCRSTRPLSVVPSQRPYGRSLPATGKPYRREYGRRWHHGGGFLAVSPSVRGRGGEGAVKLMRCTILTPCRPRRWRRVAARPDASVRAKQQPAVPTRRRSSRNGRKGSRPRRVGLAVQPCLLSNYRQPPAATVWSDTHWPLCLCFDSQRTRATPMTTTRKLFSATVFPSAHTMSSKRRPCTQRATG